jgi:energy-coupling factor transport system ATP-binding protein
MIRLEHVCYRYEASGAAVEDLSFEIKRGEFAALLGENGAGKSTVAKLIDGLLKPSSGSVSVAGLDTRKTKTSELAKRVGFLFQNPDRQICKNTVRAEIAFGLELRGLNRAAIDERVEGTLREFGFDGDREPFTLSRGERQRLALASIIAAEPEIMILDEPTTGLDYRECMQVMEAVKRLNERGATVVMVCHDMEVVLDFARRALVLSKGRLIADGATRGVFRNALAMEKASLSPPQITQLALRLGEGFKEADTASELASAVEKKRRAV